MVYRKFYISAQDIDSGIKIKIETMIEFNGGLTQGERQKVVRDLADSLMQAVPGLIYTKLSIVDVKVKNV